MLPLTHSVPQLRPAGNGPHLFGHGSYLRHRPGLGANRRVRAGRLGARAHHNPHWRKVLPALPAATAPRFFYRTRSTEHTPAKLPGYCRRVRTTAAKCAWVYRPAECCYGLIAIERQRSRPSLYSHRGGNSPPRWRLGTVWAQSCSAVAGARCRRPLRLELRAIQGKMLSVSPDGGKTPSPQGLHWTKLSLDHGLWAGIAIERGRGFDRQSG